MKAVVALIILCVSAPVLVADPSSTTVASASQASSEEWPVVADQDESPMVGVTAEQADDDVIEAPCYATECANYLRCAAWVNPKACLAGYSYEHCAITPPILGACFCEQC